MASVEQAAGTGSGAKRAAKGAYKVGTPKAAKGKGGKKKKGGKSKQKPQNMSAAQVAAKPKKRRKKKPGQGGTGTAMVPYYPKGRLAVARQNSLGWWAAALSVGAGVATAVAFAGSRPLLRNNYARSVLLTVLGVGGLFVKSPKVAAVSRSIIVVGISTAGLTLFRDLWAMGKRAIDGADTAEES